MWWIGSPKPEVDFVKYGGKKTKKTAQIISHFFQILIFTQFLDSKTTRNFSSLTFLRKTTCFYHRHPTKRVSCWIQTKVRASCIRAHDVLFRQLYQQVHVLLLLTLSFGRHRAGQTFSIFFSIDGCSIYHIHVCVRARARVRAVLSLCVDSPRRVANVASPHTFFLPPFLAFSLPFFSWS